MPEPVHLVGGVKPPFEAGHHALQLADALAEFQHHGLGEIDVIAAGLPLGTGCLLRRTHALAVRLQGRHPELQVIEARVGVSHAQAGMWKRPRSGGAVVSSRTRRWSVRTGAWWA